MTPPFILPPGGERTEMSLPVVLILATILLLETRNAASIRVPDNVPTNAYVAERNPQLRTTVFALGSFWRSEAVFGCVPGVESTTTGYAGGTKTRPEFRSLGDHAECVKITYDPGLISFRQLLDAFWTNHDSRQIFGQGPDVGNQYRSIIFTNETDETRLAVLSKEKEQAKSKSSVVTTKIMPLGTFYPAEFEHQKFELRQNPFLCPLIGCLTEEIAASNFGAKLNSYAAEIYAPAIQEKIEAKINHIINKGWLVLKDL